MVLEGKMAEVIASESRIARVFQFSERKVRDYFKQVRVSPGMYALELVIKIYVENTNNFGEISEAKRVDTETKKYKLGILKREYHHVDEVTLLVTDMITRCKSKLNSIPARASVELLNISEPREMEQKLKKLINECLKELSTYDKLSMEDIEIETEED